MKRNLRLAVYIGIGLALLSAALAAPAAWAGSSQRTQGQTVPTRGPSPTFVVTYAPTEAPTAQPPSSQPPATQAPTAQPPATALPGATATPASVIPAPAILRLTKEADRTAVWPGLDIRFTLVLTNQGANSVRDIVVEDALPAELIPGAIVSTGAAWDGRILRARTVLLPPSGRFVVVFTARVRDDLAPGGIIVNQAAATATGSQRATAGTLLVLPPAELPPTGAGLAQ